MKILFILFFVPTLVFAQNAHEYKNLVMEGGGVRGIAYAGVFKVLEEKGVLQKIEKVAGSSAGAIAGMLVSVGYNAAEIDSLMFGLHIQKFNDGNGGVIGKYNRLKKNFGLYKGETFSKWLENLVQLKTGNPHLNFEQLHQLHLSNNVFKDLYCTGTNLSKQQLEIFSVEQTPKMPIALAVRISAGIPLYFEPVALNNHYEPIKKSDTTSFVNYYVDGGMLNNYPISLFDTCADNKSNPLMCQNLRFNSTTIGIKLERPEQIDSINHNSIRIPAYRIKKFSGYLTAMTNLMMETMSRKYPGLKNELGRTIYVSDGNIPARLKKTNQEVKQLLFDNGVKAATLFFAKSEK